MSAVIMRHVSLPLLSFAEAFTQVIRCKLEATPSPPHTGDTRFLFHFQTNFTVITAGTL